LLAAADGLFASAGACGPADAWLMPQTIQAAQQLEQTATAALCSEGADLKALLEGIAKCSVELDALSALEDVERAGDVATRAVATANAASVDSLLCAEKKRLLSAFYSLESQLVAASQARL
jgi:hypothetical protein